MRGALAAALLRHVKNRDIYGIVLEAAQAPGGAAVFCLGNDAPAAVTSDPRAELTEAAAGLWRIDRCGKPFVSLLDGPVYGAGLGLVLQGTHRVAGDTTTLAASEGMAGGLSFVLPRLQRGLGLYLALSGRPIDRALAYHSGLVTHCIDSASFPEIRERLAQADPIDEVLDGLHRDPAPSPLSPHLDAIKSCFAADSPAGIVRALEEWTGPSAAWAGLLAHDIFRRSERDLDVVHRFFTGSPPNRLRDALAREFRVAMNRLSLPADVAIDALFASPIGADLELPPEPKAPSIS